MIKTYWTSLCKRLGINDAEDYLFNHITLSYDNCDGLRCYHNTDHLLHCLIEIEKAKTHVDVSKEVELAIWFHDMSYDPTKKDNEERSFSRFDELMGHHFSEYTKKLIKECILATKHNTVSSNSSNKDVQLVCDIDLSILGASDEIFDQYELNIRKEYYFVSLYDYVNGRMSVLNKILTKSDRIYQTDLFYKWYELRSHRNLRRSIDKLKKSVDIV